MTFEKATAADIGALTNLRIAYLKEDFEVINDADLLTLQNTLPSYFERHLNRDLMVYVAREQDTVVSCAFLLIVEKPMSPAFITGKTGTVLNVYTMPTHRRKGLASKLITMMLEDAAAQQLSVVELKATDDGYSLYQKLGFVDAVSHYRQMKYTIKT